MSDSRHGFLMVTKLVACRRSLRRRVTNEGFLRSGRPLPRNAVGRVHRQVGTERTHVIQKCKPGADCHGSAWLRFERVRGDNARVCKCWAGSANFVGIVPIDEPRWVIYVGVGASQKEGTGGTIAAPVFARIAKRAVAVAHPICEGYCNPRWRRERRSPALVRKRPAAHECAVRLCLPAPLVTSARECDAGQHNMPEEDIETSELKESVEASVEHALEAEREKTGWTVYLSLSTAIIAVFAAVASLESGANSNDAILEKNDAVLNQSKASDEWALYQAKVIRAAVLHGESEFAAPSNPELAGKLRDESARLKAEQGGLESKARALEEKVEAHNARAERLLDRHHRFAIAVTLFQIAVALCAIAALMKKKPLWIVALGASAIGGVLFVLGFLAPL